MTPVSANMFHVENFLCCYSLRGGTLLTLYLTSISSFFVACGIFRSVNEFSSFAGWLSIEAVVIMNILVSGFALSYFPEINKKYNRNSINAKCIRFYFIFNSVQIILGFLVFFCFAFATSNRPFDTFMIGVLGAGSWIAVFTYFTVNAYSFYLSILQPENDSRGEGLITDKSPSKDIHTPLGRKDNTKIDIPQQPLDSSANGSGNLYVELR